MKRNIIRSTLKQLRHAFLAQPYGFVFYQCIDGNIFVSCTIHQKHCFLSVHKNTILFLLLFTGFLNQLCHDGVKFCYIFRCNHRAAGVFFALFPRISGNLTALTGDALVFRKSLRLVGLGKLGRSGLSKHIEYQFQRGHVVPH